MKSVTYMIDKTNKSIGLYIHIPFCNSKCSYCDFNSYAGKLQWQDRYFKALEKELSLYAEKLNAIYGHSTVDTVFVGGGTPSAVDAEHIYNILNHCRRQFNIGAAAELSMESNPGTMTAEKLHTYKEAGITRISMGLQAAQPHLLKFLGRRHTAEQFIESIQLAKQAGFTNLNGDVIFGIPGQTMLDWKKTLELLVSLEIPHVSAYSLKIEEGTLLGDMYESGTLKPVEDELDREMYHYAIKYLKEQGLNHYELSNFSAPGYECKHNLIYWQEREYIGLGAGAHSFLNNKRFSNEPKLETYIELVENGQNPVIEDIEVTREDEMAEYMFLGLRLMKGVSEKEFVNRFGVSMLKTYNSQIDKLNKAGLVRLDGETVKLTSKGLDLANIVFMEFV